MRREAEMMAVRTAASAAGTMALTLLLLPVPSHGQERAPPRTDCAVLDAHLPPALAGWASPISLAAGTDAGSAPALPLGRAVNAELRRVSDVTYPALPERPGGSVSYGGLYGISIRDPGDYQVSLGAGAWIDLADGPNLIASTSHAPGPKCSSLKKTVVFPLGKGDHLLEITGNGAPVLTVMVSRLPK